jgi:hypothetical protein
VTGTADNLAGTRYGQLILVVRRDYGQWLCRCDCGQYTTRHLPSIKKRARTRNPIWCIQCEYFKGVGYYTFAGEETRALQARTALLAPSEPVSQRYATPVPSRSPDVRFFKGNEYIGPSDVTLYSTDLFRHSVLRELDYSLDARRLIDSLDLV